jgi:hypothetical protein
MWRNRPIKAILCGHKTRPFGQITAFGYGFWAEIPVFKGKTTFCHECIGKMTIRCAWCGKPIFVGHLVTLSIPPAGARMPEHTQYYLLDKGHACIGCANCARQEDVRAGFWTQPGRVQLLPTIFAVCPQEFLKKEIAK